MNSFLFSLWVVHGGALTVPSARLTMGVLYKRIFDLCFAIMLIQAIRCKPHFAVVKETRFAEGL
jgi:hypothetical protein